MGRTIRVTALAAMLLAAATAATAATVAAGAAGVAGLAAQAGTAALADFDGNELPDLAAGAPGETVAGAPAAGAVDARDGEAGGLPADPDEPLYFRGNDGVPGTAEAVDLFASSLSA